MVRSLLLASIFQSVVKFTSALRPSVTTSILKVVTSKFSFRMIIKDQIIFSVSDINTCTCKLYLLNFSYWNIVGIYAYPDSNYMSYTITKSYFSQNVLEPIYFLCFMFKIQLGYLFNISHNIELYSRGT